MKSPTIATDLGVASPATIARNGNDKPTKPDDTENASGNKDVIAAPTTTVRSLQYICDSPSRS